MADILNERYLTDNSIRFEYYPIKTPIGTDLNETTSYCIISENLNRWEFPCSSFLDVEGQLVNADGTVYVRGALGFYPDVTITNNFFPFLFNNITYKIGTEEIETLDNPGIITTVNSLLTYPRAFNGLDMGWALDDGDGHVPASYSDVPVYTAQTFNTPNIARAAYTLAMERLAPYVTSYNPMDFEIHDIDIVCTLDTGPSIADLTTTINTNIIGYRFNTILGLNIAVLTTAQLQSCYSYCR